MEKSRFQRIVQRRLPKRSRNISVPGSHEDRGRWVKCWNCGFIINRERLSATGASGVRHSIQAVPAPGQVGYGLNAVTIGDTGDLVLMAQMITGDNQPIKNLWVLEYPSGCPFCGCGTVG